MKSKWLYAIGTAALTVGSYSAQAQQLDLSATRCSQLEQMAKEQQSIVATWLAGYYTDEKDGDLIDLDKVKATSDRLREFCAKNPGFSLSGAAEGLLGK